MNFFEKDVILCQILAYVGGGIKKSEPYREIHLITFDPKIPLSITKYHFCTKLARNGYF